MLAVLGMAWPGAAETHAGGLPAPALLGAETYSETYSLTAYGAAGVVQLQFGITNLGWGAGRGICRLYAHDGTAAVRKHEMYARSRWRAYGAPVTGLAAPGCALHASAGAFVFTAELGGAAVAVAAGQPLRPVATPQTGIEVNDDLYRSTVLLAAAPAEITLRRPGAPPRRFAGYVHVDHSVTTMLPGDIAAGWLRFRALAGAPPLIFSARMAPGAAGFTGWTLDPAAAALQVARPDWWPASRSGAIVPTPLGELRIGRQIEVFEPLRDLGVLRRAAELLVGHPRTVLYWAELDGQTGVLEVATQD